MKWFTCFFNNFYAFFLVSSYLFSVNIINFTVSFHSETKSHAVPVNEL